MQQDGRMLPLQRQTDRGGESMQILTKNNIWKDRVQNIQKQTRNKDSARSNLRGQDRPPLQPQRLRVQPANLAVVLGRRARDDWVILLLLVFFSFCVAIIIMAFIWSMGATCTIGGIK